MVTAGAAVTGAAICWPGRISGHDMDVRLQVGGQVAEGARGRAAGGERPSAVMKRAPSLGLRRMTLGEHVGGEGRTRTGRRL